MATDTPIVPPSARQSVSDLLDDVDDGRLREELQSALPELIKSVQRTKKKGTLTITIDVSTGVGTTVLVSPKLTVKSPRGVISGAVLYADDDGNLSKSDPRQMPLKNVTPIKGGN